MPPVRPLTLLATTLLLMLGVVAAPAHAADGPEPKFRVEPAAPVAGQLVSFVAQGPRADAYRWSFGDRQGARGRRVVHRYGQAGTYSVQLEVRDDDDFETVTQQVVVAPAPAPPAPPPAPAPVPTPVPAPSPAPAPAPVPEPANAFNRVPSAGMTAAVDGLRVTVSSTSTDPDGDALAYRWEFGDGQTSDAPGGSHTYGREGTYTVKLTVSDPRGGTGTISLELTVRAGTTSTITIGGAPPAPAPAAPPAPPAPPVPSTTLAPSTSPTIPRLRPFPVVRIAGRLVGTWTYVRLLSVNAPRGATVSVRCRGRSCTRSTQRLLMQSRSSMRLRSFERRSFAAGTVLEVSVTRRGFVGKHTRVTFRSSRSPQRTDRCLTPGSTRPVVCR